MQLLQTPTSNIVAVIDDSGDITKFYAIADTLAIEFSVHYFNKAIDIETIDWDFEYKKHLLVLHFSTTHGVSIYPRHKKDLHGENTTTSEIASFLERRGY